MRRSELYVIKNPAETVEPEERVEAVRYVVDCGEIKAKGEKSI